MRERRRLGIAEIEQSLNTLALCVGSPTFLLLIQAGLYVRCGLGIHRSREEKYVCDDRAIRSLS